MKLPRAFIFMPAYNGERFIGAAIDSLRRQTFSDFELLVVDDGSQDATGVIVERQRVEDTRIDIVTHDRNRGLSAARNTGWQRASAHAEFIMNHDCDDVSLPTKLERLVAYLDAHPTVDAVGSFCRYIDADGNHGNCPPMEWEPENIRRTFGALNSLAISATLARRRVYEAIAPFREEYGGCDDYDFWARALMKGFEIANIPDVLHLIRVHQSSMGATQTAAMEAQAARVRDEYFRAIRMKPSTVRQKTLRARMTWKRLCSSMNR
jgi:glycosyltransferase involved in cell wall biosynthesis